MKLGIFMPTLNNGWVISKSSPHWKPDWFLMEQTATKAEHYGFEFLLSAVKLRGFDGPTEFWNHTLDSFTAMAGLAVRTSRIKLFASVATLTTPPPLCAKQVATVLDMSRGRFGVNIVTGWEKEEYTQMGVWPGDQHFKTRYDHADEYVAIMRELWATGRSNFAGKYFQMDDCMLGPQPEYPIEIVCAGGSERGLRFCAENGDHQFMVGKTDAGELDKHLQPLRDAMSKANRRVGALAVYTVCLRDSVAEAEDTFANWRENQDIETVATVGGMAQQDVANLDALSTKQLAFGTDAFVFNFPTLIGDARSIAEQLRAIGEVQDLNGVMLTFQDYLKDVDKFGSEVMPLLK
jgi:pyrimidine oxygenase